MEKKLSGTDISLKWSVFVTPGIPIALDDLPPGEERRFFSPISATLIYGERDAVLVDPLMTIDQIFFLADWVKSSGKNLTAIYSTHGHGDHWFGIGAILDCFPKAKALAIPAVVENMKYHAAPEVLKSFWHALLPGQIPEKLVIAEALQGNVIELEGNELIAIPVGHTDTKDTTVLYVPSIDLVVAGDVAYNGVHLYLAESDHEKRLEWIAALDKVESLKPTAVIAGHKRPGNEDGLNIIEETRQYIKDFDRLTEITNTATELYDAMIQLHPLRMNVGALWSSARAVKG